MTHIRCLLLCRWRADAHCLVLWRLRDIQSEKYWQTCFPFAVTLVICSEIPTMKLPARLSRPPEARTSQVPLPGSLTVAVAYIRDTIGDRQGARGICQKKKTKQAGEFEPWVSHLESLSHGGYTRQKCCTRSIHFLCLPQQHLVSLCTQFVHRNFKCTRQSTW